ncbi:MAG: hypothetical protein ACK476_13080 [Fluviicola sp.]|jgi:hypothetical protein
MTKINKTTILEALKQSKLEFRATQNKLCLPIIRRIYNKMSNDIKFEDIKVCDGLIIDGHHRFISSILAQKQINHVSSSKTSATIEYDWIDIEFVEVEWDTQAKINLLNRQDADFNDVTIEKIIEISNKTT